MFIFSPAAYVHILTCNLVHILTCNLIHILTCSLCSLSQCQMVPTTSQVQTCHINNKIISLLLSQWPGVQTLSTNRTCKQQMLHSFMQKELIKFCRVQTSMCSTSFTFCLLTHFCYISLLLFWLIQQVFILHFISTFFDKFVFCFLFLFMFPHLM